MAGVEAVETEMIGSLALRAAKGVVRIIGWRIATRVLGLACSLVLVRLLTPADFGLVALAFSISQAIELLSIFGIEDAVVRHHAPDIDIYDTAFTLTAIRALATGLLIAALAWPMSLFFDEPRVVPVVAFLALSTVLSGLRNIGIVDFRRNLAYQYEFRLRLIPRLMSSGVTIVIAFLFQSYWAIIVGTLVERLATTGMTYRLHPHRPRFTLVAWRELSGFSLWLWITGMVVMVRDRTGTFVVGHVLGIPAVGKFNIATDIAVAPLIELMLPLVSVLFPAFSRSSRDANQTRSLYLRSLEMSMLVMLPAGLGLALVADPFVHLVLGPMWLDVIPIVQLAAMFSAFHTFSLISRALFEARGFMRSSFVITVVSTLVKIPLCIGFTYWLGIIGAVLAAICADMIDQSFFVIIACRRLHISAAMLALRIWRPMIGAMTMFVGILVCGLGKTSPQADNAAVTIQLFLTAASGAALFILCSVVLWLLSGRPQGAEEDALIAIRRVIAATSYWIGTRFKSL